MFWLCLTEEHGGNNRHFDKGFSGNQEVYFKWKESACSNILKTCFNLTCPYMFSFVTVHS